MSNGNEPINTKKRLPFSIPFLCVALLLGCGLYFTVPWAMTQFMYIQEQDRAKKRAFLYEGQPPAEPAEASGARSGGGNRQAGGGERDVNAIFARLDADSNGKIEGAEISERLQSRMEQIDTDKDGAVTQEEFVAGTQNRSQESGAGGATVPKARRAPASGAGVNTAEAP